MKLSPRRTIGVRAVGTAVAVLLLAVAASCSGEMEAGEHRPGGRGVRDAPRDDALEACLAT